MNSQLAVLTAGLTEKTHLVVYVKRHEPVQRSELRSSKAVARCIIHASVIKYFTLFLPVSCIKLEENSGDCKGAG